MQTSVHRVSQCDNQGESAGQNVRVLLDDADGRSGFLLAVIDVSEETAGPTGIIIGISSGNSLLSRLAVLLDPDRTRSMVQHTERRAAEKESLPATESAVADHDQIGVPLFRLLDDRVGNLTGVVDLGFDG